MYQVPNGYFKRVKCPEERRNGTCEVVNCIFGHTTNHPEPKAKRRQISRVEPEAGQSDLHKNAKLNDDPRRLDGDVKTEKSSERDPAYILPKELVRAPAQVSTRKHYIQVMSKIIAKNDPDEPTPILRATDIEHKVAQTATTATYVQLVKKKAYELEHPEKFQPRTKEWSDSELLEALEHRIIPQETLSKFGYITSAPKPTIPSSNRVCRRCSTEFKLEDQLESKRCFYHPGKIAKKDKNTRIYTCCGAEVTPETDPCASADHHVFSWSNPGEMHFFLPFKSTEDLFPLNDKAYKAIGIDCEMGFTTQGFELLRVTAIDFFSGKEVIDILVKPIGEIVDLNTKFSGVASIKDDADTFWEGITKLGQVMDHRTILIGHGLENDLNAMRMLHKRVVDTAILYPKHKATPKFRYSLKQLAFEYLGRVIQTGEHDSGEDSLAAIDVVKHFIKKEAQR
ncbi:RNA exonuclease 3 [Meyerozyma sp. JA9]|nr:RNA exonuclease 3 [Meyerozyma sp. JA9]